MKYTIEIDTSTKKGTELFQYIQKHKASKVVSIHQWTKLTPEIVALPNEWLPTDWQWEEYLNRKQGKGKPAAKAFNDIRRKLNALAEE
jgi:hypothetical protein